MSDAPSQPPSPPRGSLRADGGRGRRRLGEILCERGLIDADQLASALAEQAGMDLVDPTAVAIDPALLEGFDLDLARRHSVLPLSIDGAGRITLALTDPSNRAGLEAAARFLDAPVDAVLCSEPALDAALSAAVERAAARAARPPEPLVEPEFVLQIPADPPPIGPLAAAISRGGAGWEGLLSALVAHLIQLGGDRMRFSDRAGDASGQVRVSGQWVSVLQLHGDAADGLVDGLGSCLEPDDQGALELRLGGAGEGRWLAGSIALRGGGRRLDLRLRVPEPARDLAGLGFDEDVQRRLRQWTASREGLLLLVGPAASGKSTSLRALAGALARYRDVVFLGEGPPPEAEGVRFVDSAGGLAALQGALDSQPRVLVVDDASDPEIARAALTAAQRHSLVLAGLEAHDAHDALQSLRDRGLPDDLLGDAVLGAIEHHLPRGLCASCRTQAPPDLAPLRSLGLLSTNLPAQVPRTGLGCADCGGRGTTEGVLLATRVDLGGGIPSGCSPADLRGLVDRGRPRRALDIGLTLVLAGRVGLAELARVLAAPPPRPIVRAEGGGWSPGMPDETVEDWSPVDDGASLDQLLDLDPDLDGDDRHVILLFDPKDTAYQGLAAILPHDQCRIVAASQWSEALRVVRSERPTAVLLLAAADPVATKGRIRAFRDDLTSAFLPISVLVPPGTPPQDLLEAGADQVLPVSDAQSVRSGLLALIERVS